MKTEHGSGLPSVDVEDKRRRLVLTCTDYPHALHRDGPLVDDILFHIEDQRVGGPRMSVYLDLSTKDLTALARFFTNAVQRRKKEKNDQ